MIVIVLEEWGRDKGLMGTGERGVCSLPLTKLLSLWSPLSVAPDYEPQ